MSQLIWVLHQNGSKLIESSAYTYDAAGNRLSRTERTPAGGNNTTQHVSNYSYDAIYQLTQVVLDGSTSEAYTYDAVGNRLSRTEKTPGSGSKINQAVSNYSYDAIYQLTQTVLNGNTSETYTYDAVGNRLSGPSGGTYSYNSSNELTSLGSVTFAYDNNGNRTSMTNGSSTATFTWDFENRLTSVTLPGAGGTVTFKYDPFGRRIYKSSSSGTTIYAYDGDNMVEQLNSSGTATARYTQGLGIDEPLEVYEGGKSYYYHADGLGSVVALTKSTGTAANTYFGYNTFGGMPAPSETVANPFRFTGRDYDSETGLYYYRARYYDSLFGRFLSEDPERFLQSPNFYNYALSNPVRYADPTGMQFVDPGLAVQMALNLRPRNLPIGTQFRYWRPFTDGFSEALNRLNSLRCAELFGGPCHVGLGPDTAGADRMRATEYRFAGPLPQGPQVAAQTVDDTHVQINTMGLYVTAVSGRIHLPNGTNFDLGSPVNVQAFILLHELGHQLKGNTGFREDVDAEINSAHSVAIIKACFQ